MSSLNEVTLLPGEYIFSAEPQCICTLLGSCVAVCLHDPRHCWSGMNHFLLPRRTDPTESEGKYGDTAIQALLHLALKHGSERRDLVASVFGGGRVATSGQSPVPANVGTQNTVQAHETLAQLGIPVAFEETGGDVSRRIWLETPSHRVRMRRVNPMGSARPRDKTIVIFEA